MDKWIGCNPTNQLEVDMWYERKILLTQPDGMGERERKEEEDFRERESTCSLDFLMIGLPNSNETRGKVDPHCKSYAWVPILWSFDNSGR